MGFLKKALTRLALPLLVLAANGGCSLFERDAYIAGEHQPVYVYVTPEEAVCDVTQGDAYAGAVRNGFGKIYVAKSRELVTVKCNAIGYEPRGATLSSLLTFHAAFRCVFDALCEPAVRSGELNQYPGKVELILPTVQPPTSRQAAAAQARLAAETRPPAPAAMPEKSSSPGRLPPLPPAVQAMREKPEKADAAVAADSPADAPLGTWRTTSPATRAWWGRSEPQSFAMPPGALLSLQRTDGDWGLFDYVGEDGTRGRVWIALADVRLAN